ncbi:hypothetical protein Tco_1012752 [Tanacetum coccineum]
MAQESSSKRAGDELEQESIKKQKVDDDQETTKMKEHIEVVPDEEEVAINAIPLATKPPSIVNFKILKEGKINYFQIIRADGSSKRYSAFIHMLRSFDREDLETLWKLVKAKHGYTRPEEDYERVLWDDLKTMFEPHVEDLAWRNLQGNKVLIWKLFDSCGGRIVGIKRLLDDLRVTAAKLMLLVQKLLLLVLEVNAAGMKVTTAERLQLLEESIQVGLTILVTAILESSTVAATTVPPKILPFTPIPQQSTPNPIPTTGPTTTSIPTLLDFSSLFEFDQRLDKDLFESYCEAYSLKRDCEGKDKDKDPPAGSDQGLKKRNTSKDAEPPKGPKSKDFKISSSKETKSQPKSSGKSAQAEEPVFEAADIEMPLNQGSNLDDTDDQPNVEATPKCDWFKKPKRPPTPDPD